jgi:hypothetical protein
MEQASSDHKDNVKGKVIAIIEEAPRRVKPSGGHAAASFGRTGGTAETGKNGCCAEPRAGTGSPIPARPIQSLAQGSVSTGSGDRIQKPRQPSGIPLVTCVVPISQK